MRRSCETALNSEVPGTIVSAFVSSIAYQRLRTAATVVHSRPVTATYAEASPAAQMQLIRHLYRHRVMVGVLLGPTSRGLQPLIERAAAAADLGVSCVEVRTGDNPVRSLAALTSASVLLAVPDPDLYNAQVARAILDATSICASVMPSRGKPVFTEPSPALTWSIAGPTCVTTPSSAS